MRWTGVRAVGRKCGGMAQGTRVVIWVEVGHWGKGGVLVVGGRRELLTQYRHAPILSL